MFITKLVNPYILHKAPRKLADGSTFNTAWQLGDRFMLPPSTVVAVALGFHIIVVMVSYYSSGLVGLWEYDFSEGTGTIAHASIHDFLASIVQIYLIPIGVTLTDMNRLDFA